MLKNTCRLCRYTALLLLTHHNELPWPQPQQAQRYMEEDGNRMQVAWPGYDKQDWEVDK